MKVLLVLGLSTLFILLVHGQSIATTPDPLCADVKNFSECKVITGEDLKCDENSKCFCKDQKPYCRCNNYFNEWFIGEKCNQKWTTITFGLVASLPGLALAVLVGVTVFFVSKLLTGKKNKKGKSNPAFNQEPEDDMFKNMVFASDLKEQPRSPPESMRPPSAMPSRNYSQQRGVHPAQDMPSMGGPPQSNSYGSRMGPALSNPYAKSSPGRPFFEGQSPPQGYNLDYGYRATQPPVNGMRVMAADFPQSSSPHPPFPRPDYNAPQRSMMSGRY